MICSTLQMLTETAVPKNIMFGHGKVLRHTWKMDMDESRCREPMVKRSFGASGGSASPASRAAASAAARVPVAAACA